MLQTVGLSTPRELPTGPYKERAAAADGYSVTIGGVNATGKVEVRASLSLQHPLCPDNPTLQVAVQPIFNFVALPT